MLLLNHSWELKGLIPYEKELTAALSIYVDILVNSLFNTF